MENRAELLRLLAELLEYPGPDLPARARQCEMLLTGRPEAAATMKDFAAFAGAEDQGRLEEIYTSSFDLNPQCYPYAGYQLFGEDPKRSELMIGLQQSFCARGFNAGTELPDHVPLLLRFLSELDDPEMERELRDLVLSPCLAKMAKTLEEKNNPYAKAVSAALSVISIP